MEIFLHSHAIIFLNLWDSAYPAAVMFVLKEGFYMRKHVSLLWKNGTFFHLHFWILLLIGTFDCVSKLHSLFFHPAQFEVKLDDKTTECVCCHWRLVCGAEYTVYFNPNPNPNHLWARTPLGIFLIE